MLEAVAYAHRVGFAHRDLKPANIFLAEGADGAKRTKVLDFGIAKTVEVGTAASARATTGGTFAFTPAYGAPEQFNPALGATGTWTDVQALGLILLELLIGEPPLGNDMNVMALLAARMADNGAAFNGQRLVQLGVAEPVARVLERALAFDPNERTTTAARLHSELEVAVRRAPTTVPQEPNIPMQPQDAGHAGHAVTTAPKSVDRPQARRAGESQGRRGGDDVGARPSNRRLSRPMMFGLPVVGAAVAVLALKGVEWFGSTDPASLRAQARRQ